MPFDKIEMIALVDSIRACGQKAIDDLKHACIESGINEDTLFFPALYNDGFAWIANEIWGKWHTIDNFNVGDKVYVVPLTFTFFKNCVRATVIDIDKYGYHLKAFKRDSAGIYMFNIWDKDLRPRINKKNLPVSPELLIR